LQTINGQRLCQTIKGLPQVCILLQLAQIYQYGESDRQDADLRQAFDCLTEALAIYRLQGQDEAAALVQRQLHALEQPDAYTG